MTAKQALPMTISAADVFPHKQEVYYTPLYCFGVTAGHTVLVLSSAIMRIPMAAGRSSSGTVSGDPVLARTA